MRRRQLSIRQRTPGTLALARDWFNDLFNTAPVMMHGIDRDFHIVKVNRRWLETLGYEKDDVLGRRPTYFQTEDSRARTEEVLERKLTDSQTEDSRPHTGSVRSMARRFVGRGGKVLDIIIDVEACQATACKCSAYGTLTDVHDAEQREQASDTLTTLKNIITIQQILENALAADEGDGTEEASQAAPHPPGRVARAAEWGEAAGAFLELAMDISADLRGLLQQHEEWPSKSAEQQRELVLAARSLDRTLAELADTLAAVRLRPE